MKIIIIIASLFLLIIFGIEVYLFSLINKKEQQLINTASRNNVLDKYNLNWKVYFLMLIALILILTSFFAPLIFTTQTEITEFDFTKTGPIGDTIGGLMNPFIALAGVIVTGLAFYIQYKANELQREMFLLNQDDSNKKLQLQIDLQNEQIKRQQTESQFYEMLRLHRENISEMKITGYDFEEVINKKKRKVDFIKRFEKITEGRKIFVTMKIEFEFILELYKKNNKLDKIGFNKCYRIFFAGVDESDRKYPEDKFFTKQLRLARAQHQNPSKSLTKNSDRKKYLNLRMDFNYKPFSGHASRLGHYFRHLYLTVKSIANSEVVTTYEERMKYLHLLRAQLSNHEQIFLFYNWVSGYGDVWEDDNHQFFTEYCMVRNLWYDNLVEDDYIKEKVVFLRNRKVENRKGKMFEIDG